MRQKHVKFSLPRPGHNASTPSARRRKTSSHATIVVKSTSTDTLIYTIPTTDSPNNRLSKKRKQIRCPTQSSSDSTPVLFEKDSSTSWKVLEYCLYRTGNRRLMISLQNQI